MYSICVCIFKVLSFTQKMKTSILQIVLGPSILMHFSLLKLMSFPSLWMWLPSERSVVCVNIHELCQIHSTSEILVNSNSKAWSNEHWMTSYTKIYIHIDNLNWYSSMNIYGITHKIAQKKRDILYLSLSIHELYSYTLLNKIIMFIYVPDT